MIANGKKMLHLHHHIKHLIITETDELPVCIDWYLSLSINLNKMEIATKATRHSGVVIVSRL